MADKTTSTQPTFVSVHPVIEGGLNYPQFSVLDGHTVMVKDSKLHILELVSNSPTHGKTFRWKEVPDA